jgi:type 1 glutamine amidotransferase
VLGAQAPSDDAWQYLKTYDAGQSTAPLIALEREVAGGSNQAASRQALAARLVNLVKDGQISRSARLFAAQQLRLVADDSQVPVLATLLNDAATADLGRVVLQGLASAGATQALIDALGHLEGPSLIGPIQSLALRREPAAVNALGRLLTHSNPQVAAAAARALGSTGTEDAARLLLAAQPSAELRTAFADAALRCGQRLTRQGQPEQARALYTPLLADAQPLHVRLAALAGWAQAAGDGAVDQIAAAIAAAQPTRVALALELVRRSGSPALLNAVQTALPKLGASTRMLAQGVLAEHGNVPALAELSRLSTADDLSVRADAARELRRLRTAAPPAVRAQIDAGGADPEGAVEVLTPPPYAGTAIDQRRQEIGKSLPAGSQLVAYLDCGVELQSAGPAGGVAIRQINGQGWRFENAAAAAGPTFGTVAFDGGELRFEVTGLDPAKHYALGISWWDYDNVGRVQTVRLTGGQPRQTAVALNEVRLPNYQGTKEGPGVSLIPIAAKQIGGGSLRVGIQRVAGPNAVVSELWVLETAAVFQPAVVATATRASARILLVTGIDYPGHPWKETAPVLKAILEKDPRLTVRVAEDPAFLDSAALTNYDAVIIHFMDWETPGPGEAARENLQRFVAGGKGLMLTHFACGAWDNNEWPEFARLAGRVWDPKLRGHDPHGTFKVEIVDPVHPITKGLAPFETLDELYTCLAGDAPIHVVAKAVSKVDQKEYPMGFVLDYGRGRVFHTPLGHDARAYASPGVAEFMRRGCVWAAGL